jgi:hypothetical protein
MAAVRLALVNKVDAFEVSGEAYDIQRKVERISHTKSVPFIVICGA